MALTPGSESIMWPINFFPFLISSVDSPLLSILFDIKYQGIRISWYVKSQQLTKNEMMHLFFQVCSLGTQDSRKIRMAAVRNQESDLIGLSDDSDDDDRMIGQYRARHWA